MHKLIPAVSVFAIVLAARCRNNLDFNSRPIRHKI